MDYLTLFFVTIFLAGFQFVDFRHSSYFRITSCRRQAILRPSLEIYRSNKYIEKLQILRLYQIFSAYHYRHWDYIIHEFVRDAIKYVKQVKPEHYANGVIRNVYENSVERRHYVQHTDLSKLRVQFSRGTSYYLLGASHFTQILFLGKTKQPVNYDYLRNQ